MKLHITRSQTQVKGFLGNAKGVKFNLTCRVDFTPEEQAWVNHYQAQRHVLLSLKTETGEAPDLVLSDLLQEKRYYSDELTSLLRKEQQVTDACAAFSQLLQAMATYGGEQIIDLNQEQTIDELSHDQAA